MPQILVLEPYPALRQALTVLLQRAGWYVTTASTARTTVQALAQDSYDVLVVDLDNTGGEGWCVLHALQWRPARLAVVALLSPDSRQWPDAQAHETPVLVPTPVRREALLMAVRVALTSARDTPGGAQAP